MKRRFKNKVSGHIFFETFDDGILRSVYSKLTYTIEEAESSTELTELK